MFSLFVAPVVKVKKAVVFPQMNLLMFYTNTRVSFKSGLFLYWFDITFNQMPELTVKLFILHLKLKKKKKNTCFW